MVQKHKTHDSERSAVVQRKSKQAAPAQSQREQVTHPANVLQRTVALPPAALRPAHILTLQRGVGNRAVQRMLIQRRVEAEDPLRGHSLSRRDLSGMDDLKLHYNSSKPAELNALAYTQGTNIRPRQIEDELLRHEVSHVGERRQGRVRPTFQMKLAVGPVNDHYEQEADRVAATVMQTSGPAAPQIQRQGLEEEDQTIQAKPVVSSITPLIQRQELNETEEEDVIQRRSDGSQARVESGVEDVIERTRGGGQPLPGALLGRMEKSFGADFSAVRVHANSESDTLNRSLHARAFTTGHDMFFRRGEYNPHSRGGQELIAHELTHVVQQNGGKSGNKNLSARRSTKPVIQRGVWDYLKRLVGYADEQRGEFKVDVRGKYGNIDNKEGEAHRRKNYNEDLTPDVINYALMAGSGGTAAGKAITDRIQVVKSGADFFTGTTPLMSEVGKNLSIAGAVSAGVGILPAAVDTFKGVKGWRDQSNTKAQREISALLGASGVGNVGQQIGSTVFHTANRFGSTALAAGAETATGAAALLTGIVDMGRGAYAATKARQSIAILKNLQYQESELIRQGAKQAQSTQELRKSSAGWTLGKGVLTALGGALLLGGAATTPLGWLLIGVGALVGLKGAYNKWRDKKKRREAIVSELLGISKEQKKWRRRVEALEGPAYLPGMSIYNRKEIKALGPSPIEEKLRTNGEGFISVDHYYSNYISKTADDLHEVMVDSRYNLETQAIVKISKWRGEREDSRADAIRDLKSKTFRQIHGLQACSDLAMHPYGTIERLLNAMGLKPNFKMQPAEPTPPKIGKALHE